MAKYTLLKKICDKVLLNCRQIGIILQMISIIGFIKYMQYISQPTAEVAKNNHVISFVCILGTVLCQSNNEKIIVASIKEQCVENMFKKLYLIKLGVFNLII